MITQTCNLSCNGCTNYSNLRHSGYVSWQQGRAQLESWIQRIDLLDFGIMGGEPLINPEWREWIRGVREILPRAQIRFTTNGLLLHRAPDILELMDLVGNIVFKITVHVRSCELEHAISAIMSKREWRPVTEHGINRFLSDNGVRLQINRPTEFVKTFQGSYHDMRPHHSDPAQAFAACVQQTCPLLYQGRIYKCSTAGLLKDTLAKFGDPNLNQWQPYLPTGISAQDPQDTILEFIENFGRPHSICGQCPDHTAPLIPHLATVSFKSRATTDLTSVVD